MTREKLQLLIKALPKQIRRICVPVPNFITTFLSAKPDINAPLLSQLVHPIACQAGNIICSARKISNTSAHNNCQHIAISPSK
ncbi:DUF3418 domain-containing protein [Snodgrassella sp. ESL0253]|uniref:DUF3418 domain-containing protein n=1 Tax=Snodgrassella sp. ESL0253 TaxID=2705031 RepID=UPI00158438C1|nr:DUF3418 domain-containing protein [Snodgrassella sp. ESL0253]NUE67357.1 DUF3418 domain-containing protein [Snodgrassella sp. ESL0253]